MALKNEFEPADVARRLADWLPGALGVAGPVTVDDVVIPQASGMSSETVLFRASWTGDDGPVTRGLVVRVPPAIGLFPDPDVTREAATMRALAAHADAPVPDVLAHETSGDVLGGEFLLLERAHGDVPGDDPPFVTGGWVVDLPAERRGVMYDGALRAIAGIQAVDVDATGLASLHDGSTADAVLEREIGYWREFYAWARAADGQSPLVERALDRLEETRPSLDGPLVPVWGDARFGNMMFGPDQQVTAVLDWEMASVGPREVDLGYWLFFDRMYSEGIGAPRLEGFPERDAVIARYTELTGHEPRHLDWFEAWGALRGSILLVRVGNLMIEHGLMPPGAPFPVSNPAAHVLAALLELPPPDADAAWITGSR
ncbi:MAG: phosphotransferase family protein [Solirubrobacteraceae bacterium]|nr:phosphotransferase family protein [Solirubrobacteraceae bacterium]